MNKHTVFVYGTLLKGFGNHRLISSDPHNKFIGADSIKGIMYGNGIPFVDTDGDGVVKGELYEIDDYTLDSLDGLEGYNPKEPDQGGYTRITVTTHNGVDTFVYRANRNRLSWLKSRYVGIIKDGDYRAYRETLNGSHK